MQSDSRMSHLLRRAACCCFWAASCFSPRVGCGGAAHSGAVAASSPVTAAMLPNTCSTGCGGIGSDGAPTAQAICSVGSSTVEHCLLSPCCAMLALNCGVVSV